jgi:hypothetical protein
VTAAVVNVAGERYEVAKAVVDLVEAEAELAAAATHSERMMALDRIDDARARIAHWRRADSTLSSGSPD